MNSRRCLNHTRVRITYNHLNVIIWRGPSFPVSYDASRLIKHRLELRYIITWNELEPFWCSPSCKKERKTDRQTKKGKSKRKMDKKKKEFQSVIWKYEINVRFRKSSEGEGRREEGGRSPSPNIKWYLKSREEIGHISLRYLRVH